MPEIGLLFYHIHVREALQSPSCGYFNDIQIQKQMFLVSLIYLFFAYENVEEGFFDKQVQNVVLFMLEEQINQANIEFGVADASEDILAGKGDAVAQDF